MPYTIGSLPTMDPKKKLHLTGFKNFKNPGRRAECMKLVIGGEYVDLDNSQLRYLQEAIEGVLSGKFNSETQYEGHMRVDIQVGDDVYIDGQIVRVCAIVKDRVYHEPLNNGNIETPIQSVVNANTLNHQSVK